MKRNTLSTALLAGLAGTAGLVGVSNAVNINPDGIGQALVYPYYTTRDSQLNLMSVVNTSDQVKAVKVRFIEGKASQEVLDFNLYMSPYDVWTAAIVDDGTGAAVATFDASCTVPTVTSTGIPFRNSQYQGDAALDNSVDRTREGYVELIEMAVVTGTHAAWATHTNGVPGSCANLVSSWASSVGSWRLSVGTIETDVVLDGGSIFGGMLHVDPLVGSGAAVNAEAFEAFDNVDNNHTQPGSLFPTLAQAGDDAAGVGDSLVFYAGGVVASTWSTIGRPNGADSVSAVITDEEVMNEWSVEVNGSIEAKSDWVVTFPLKRFYVLSDGSGSISPWSTNLTVNGACEGVDLGLWDREERTPGFENLDFSPPQNDVVGANLCWETSTITFANSNALSSALAENISIDGVAPGEAGWMLIDFNFSNAFTMVTEDPELVDDLGRVYYGHASVGFWLLEFVDAGTVNYSGAYAHRGTRRIL